jgi:hypothetical protein
MMEARTAATLKRMAAHLRLGIWTILANRLQTVKLMNEMNHQNELNLVSIHRLTPLPL